MHQNPNSTNNPGPATNSNKTHIVSSHPWWRGIGHDGFSQNMLGESMTDITTEQQANGDSGSKTSKLQVKSGPDEGTEANREIKVIAMSQSDGKFGEQQSQQYTASIVHQPVGECVTPPTQLELVRHNIACVSYPFSDSYYGGVVPACGPQALPYLHESRHLHAMRRPRGCGGRFLNTKKVDARASNADSGNNSTVTVSTHPTNSTSSTSMFSQNMTSGNSSSGQMQQHKYSTSNGSGCYSQHQGFQLFRYNPLLDDSVKRGDFSGQKSERNRALTIT
ncbi:nuclear transcription factor Y subunit A-10-like isoform X2 [Mangifera indica]|uniref:nuclear transcription factor Y subunit A-10-like isoform X2 n=1 Tax=Mangifera indica TaxID=29780 RepID=UPI001CF9C819|nr:nuclear transcription factor Y subunit A-10-like isoform X2 [Mangifera indica]